MKSPAVKSLAVVVVLLAAMTWANARSTANVVEGAQYAATSSVVERGGGGGSLDLPDFPSTEHFLADWPVLVESWVKYRTDGGLADGNRSAGSGLRRWVARRDPRRDRGGRRRVQGDARRARGAFGPCLFAARM